MAASSSWFLNDIFEGDVVTFGTSFAGESGALSGAFNGEGFLYEILEGDAIFSGTGFLGEVGAFL